MLIDGMLFDVDVSGIINELKRQLENRGVFLFAKTRDSGEDLMVCCPYHKEGQERNPSAGIRKEDGLFHCLACGETHSLPEMIGDCFDSDYLFGKKWLIDNFVVTTVAHRDLTLNIGRDLPKTEPSSVISEAELDTYRYVHPYMYERGLTDSIIDKFDIGYDKQTNSITFPVRDKNGDCMFVARRSVKTKYFDLPKEINKPLYGMYELMNSNIIRSDRVYVCEGLFDCLRLWCNGKLAVAGFGCLFSDYQIKQLQDLPVRSLVLALDNDEAGRKAEYRLTQLIRNKLLYSVQLPESRKDVGECTDEEIQDLEAEPV